MAEVVDLILKKSSTGIFYLGENQSMATHLGLKRCFLAVPILKTIDFLRILTVITYENLLGRKALKAFDTTSTSEQLAIDFKTYEESIQVVFAPKKNG